MNDSFAGRSRAAILTALLLLWVLALLPGIRYLLAYERTAGPQSPGPGSWPDTKRLVREASLPTLVVALHPRCSCSRATLTELVEAAAEVHAPYKAILLIYQPHRLPGGSDYRWQAVDLYREAQAALHAQVVLDDDGRIAASFGARTSGEVLLYAAQDSPSKGNLLFAGGVTAGRGMLGANRGLESLKDALAGRISTQPADPPVFGCALSSNSGPARSQAGR